jgi:hypothetical protein
MGESRASHARRVILTDVERRTSLVSLEALLMQYGIDVRQPYIQIDLPCRVHEYLQSPLLREAAHD